MSRGTWQGSGTWQSSGPDLTGLIGIAVLVGVAYAAAEVVLALIWYIAAVLAVVLAAAIGAGIWLICTRRSREARAAEAYAARFRELQERQRVAAATVLAPLEQHTHYHVHVGDQQAAIIRQALPGTAGDAITEGK